MNITRNIKKYIRIQGITESDLAKKINTTQQNMNRILNDDDIKWSTIEKIALALEVSPKIFLENNLDYAQNYANSMVEETQAEYGNKDNIIDRLLKIIENKDQQINILLQKLDSTK